ncbi:type II toxin-antitoxin system RelB/DinJ family antitoxin [Hydrogenivirga sp.]
MATKVRTNVYLDKELKEKGRSLFREYGLSLSDAFNLFLAKVVKEKELPLDELIPQDTLRAIEDARRGKRMKSLTLDELRDLINEKPGNS